MSDTRAARIKWIDFLRGVAILFVLLGHTSVPFENYIFGFHMPLFYIITGMLYKYKDDISDKAYIKSIALKYIKPYFFFSFINLILYMTVKIILERPNVIFTLKQIFKYMIGILYSRGSYEFMPNCSPLWFLTSLFCLLTIFRFIEKIHNSLLKYTIIILLPCISAILDTFNVIKLFWNLDTAMMAVLFMYIGICVKKYIKKWDNLNFIQLFSLFILLYVIGITAIKNNTIESVCFDNNDYGNIFMMLIGSISLSFLIIIMCYRLRDNLNNFITKYIIWLGKNTIFIMSFDYFSRSCAYMILSKEQWLPVFIVKVAIVSIGALIYKNLTDKVCVK